MNTIGTRVRAARIEAGISQKELADKIGVKQPTISQLEKGSSAGSGYLPAIASALGVSALWLQSEKGPKHPIQNISARELMLITAYRESTDEGKTFIEMACASAPKARPLPDSQ
jgi:transcriptional regulator with XRE-family HTH domain